MNECSFLTVAQQGRSGWQHYLIGLLTIALTVLVFVLGISITLLISFAVVSDVPFSDFVRDLDGQSLFLENTQVSLFLVFLVGVILLIGLYIAVTHVHHRPFLSLVSADASIQWLRIGHAFIAWLGLWIVNIAILALIQPQRYVWVFRWSQWWPVLLWSPLVLFSTGIAGSLVYAYILQGSSSLIRRPVRLAIIWGVTIGLISTLSGGVLGIEQVIAAIVAWFWVWLVLKDDRLELWIGVYMANIAMSFLVETPSSTIQVPGVFSIANTTPDAIIWISWLIRIVLFYLFCFGWPSHPFSLTADRHPSRGQINP